MTATYALVACGGSVGTSPDCGNGGCAPSSQAGSSEVVVTASANGISDNGTSADGTSANWTSTGGSTGNDTTASAGGSTSITRVSGSHATGSAAILWTATLPGTSSVTCNVYDDNGCECMVNSATARTYYTMLCSNNTASCVCSTGNLLNETALVTNVQACPGPSSNSTTGQLGDVWVNGCGFPSN